MDSIDKIKEIEKRIRKIIYILFPFSTIYTNHEYPINAYSVVVRIFYKGEMLCFKHMIPKLGLFDEDDYAQYFSDDICRRIVREINEKILGLESEREK